MNILGQLSLSSFSEKQIEEIYLSGSVYTKLNCMGNNKRNKAMISDIFDLIIEHFYMGDLKLKYGENLGFDDDAIYVDGAFENYEEIFIDLLKKVVEAYFKRIDEVYMSIEDDMYKLIKLSLLNNDTDMLDKLSNNVVYELVKDMEFTHKIDKSKIYKKDVACLIAKNNSRNKKLLDKCCDYELDCDLSSIQIRNVFSCFASGVFNKANIKQKAHLMNLVYNYFSFSKENRTFRYKKVINSEFDNIEALVHIVNDLSIKDSSNNLSAIRNQKLLEDFKSGFKYIVKNEIGKAEITRLDEVSIKNSIKK